jgi:hypothetical protein
MPVSIFNVVSNNEIYYSVVTKEVNVAVTLDLYFRDTRFEPRIICSCLMLLPLQTLFLLIANPRFFPYGGKPKFQNR